MIIPEEGIQALDNILGEVPHKYAAPLIQFLGRFVQVEKAEVQDAAPAKPEKEKVKNKKGE